MDKIRISVQIKLTLNGKLIEYNIRPKEDSPIYKFNLLDEHDMPEDFYESYGMARPEIKNNKEYSFGTVSDILDVVRFITPLYFSVSQGNPILWVCTRNHALVHENIFSKKRNVKFTILRGSLRHDNPYKPLIADWENSRGSADEHIIMLEKYK